MYDRCSDIWFDDVDEVLIEPSKTDSASSRTDPLVKPYSFDGWASAALFCLNVTSIIL